MKTFIGIALLALLPAIGFAQTRESVRSSSPYNGSAGRATSEKFNGQKPDGPPKPKPQTGKQPVQGPTQNGGRVKNPKTNNGNS
jgi:hypothetical protein